VVSEKCLARAPIATLKITGIGISLNTMACGILTEDGSISTMTIAVVTAARAVAVDRVVAVARVVAGVELVGSQNSSTAQYLFVSDGL
jgi:hypothetical protein